MILKFPRHLLNNFFLGYQRDPHRREQQSSTNIETFTTSSFFALSLSSSTNILLFALVDFLPEESMTPFLYLQSSSIPKCTSAPLSSTSSHSPSPYASFRFFTTQHGQAPPTTPHRSLSEAFLTPSLHITHFIYFLSPPLAASLSVFYVLLLIHLLHSKKKLFLPFLAIFVRKAVKSGPSYLS